MRLRERDWVGSHDLVGFLLDHEQAVQVFLESLEGRIQIVLKNRFLKFPFQNVKGAENDGQGRF
jgi:hypothetical protein